MRPVLILQNLSADDPAYLGTWLQAQGVVYEVLNTEAGDTYPDTMDGYAALAVLGGVMSANDDLPSLRHAERLILQAMQRDLPVIGHCLGGQLMARALGARVAESPAPEIGWQRIDVHGSATARAWFGDAPAHTVMQWHGEAFDLPAGAEALASSAACPHQAFAIGPHLALQFHAEIDAAKLQVWSSEQSDEWRDAQERFATVQGKAAMRAQAAAVLPAHQQLAGRIYRRWLSTTHWADWLPSAS